MYIKPCTPLEKDGFIFFCFSQGLLVILCGIGMLGKPIPGRICNSSVADTACCVAAARTGGIYVKHIPALQQVHFRKASSVPLTLDGHIFALGPRRLEAQAPTQGKVPSHHAEAPPQCRALHDQQNAEGHCKVREDPIESPL